MNILQIVPSFEVGGAETMCVGLCLELRKLGHSVTAVSLSAAQSKLTRDLTEAGVELRLLGKGPGMDLSCVSRLRAVIREVRPQVIHTHLHALKYAALALGGGRSPSFIPYTIRRRRRR